MSAKYFLPLIGLLSFPTITSGATLQVIGVASASGGAGISEESDFIYEQSSLRADVSKAVDVLAAFGGGAAAADYEGSIDGETGELRFSLNGGADKTPCVPASCNVEFLSSLNLRLTEELFVTGSGSLTVFMQVDAFWISPGWNFVASTSVSPGANSDLDLLNLSSLTTPDILSVDQLLSATVDISDAVNQKFDLDWRLQGEITPFDVDGIVPSFLVSGMDASNTATIFFEASDGLTVTGGTDGFLSDAAYNSQYVPTVPLPAGGLLLLSGLSGIVGLKRRKKQAT